MKNKSSLVIFGILSVLLFATSINVAHATVGGPTFVYDIKFNPKTNSVYYTEINQGGRGCVPELKSINIINSATSTVYSCADGEKTSATDSDYYSKHEQKIRAYTSSFVSLLPINLKNNNVSVKITETGSEKIEDYIYRRNFNATIFQDGVEKAIIPTSGCDPSQPFLVDGYSVSSTSDKLLLLISRKSDCMEGGYVGESIYMVSDVKMVDPTNSNDYKIASALSPHIGTLIAYANADGNDITPTSTPEVPVDTSIARYSPTILILPALLILALGIVFGKLWSKK